jgi:deazaflavin-dependent oxidoreductase (nitroreductase family)
VSETHDREEEPGFDREQYLYLTTHGRKSGKLREIEIWFTHLVGRFYIIAEYPTSQWLQNLRANAEVEVRVGSHHFSGHARILSEREDADLVHSIQDLSRSKYGWGDGVVVELSPRM